MHAKISSLEVRFTRKIEWLWLINTGVQTARIIDIYRITIVIHIYSVFINARPCGSYGSCVSVHGPDRCLIVFQYLKLVYDFYYTRFRFRLSIIINGLPLVFIANSCIFC